MHPTAPRNHFQRRERNVSNDKFSLRSLQLILLFFAASCIPAQEVPAILSQTPGAPVIVTDDTYTSTVFSTRYPSGWRVITSPANAPPFVTFASPDNCLIIVVSVEPIDLPAPSGCTDQIHQKESRTLTFGDQTIYAAASAPQSAWDDLAPLFERTLVSISLP
jgi:hypothetical protein